MIQRAENVWLLYDSRTEGLKTGEESRYIKQLEYHFRVPLERFVATAGMKLAPEKNEIEKTPEDIETIRNSVLSASSLQNYLYCPAKFYYHSVKHLKTEDEVAESLDAGKLGTVFHDTMCALYLPFKESGELVRVADLDRMIADRKAVKATIRELIKKEMQTIDVAGRDLVVEEVIVEYVLQTLKHDRNLLVRSGSEGFRILDLEDEMNGEFEGFKIVGYSDRIDTYQNGEVRIVDYKTGRVEDEDINITDDNAGDVVEKLFGPSNVGRPKIALQLFIYGLLSQEQASMKGKPIVNSIYSVSRMFTSPLEDRPQSAEFTRLTRERLKDMLAEMVDPDVPFRRTDELRTCSYCDFKMICGR